MGYGNREVAHMWASQNKARATGSNFFFDGELLFSYGRHFTVGRILPDGTAVLSQRSYSSSTGRHQSYARQAVSHRKLVYCYDAGDPASPNRDSALSDLKDALEVAKAKGQARDVEAGEPGACPAYRPAVQRVSGSAAETGAHRQALAGAGDDHRAA